MGGHVLLCKNVFFLPLLKYSEYAEPSQAALDFRRETRVVFTENTPTTHRQFRPPGKQPRVTCSTEWAAGKMR